MIYQDFIIDSVTNDLQIINGDFVVGPSDNQHVSDIIMSPAGSFKQFPSLGVGVMNYLKSQNGLSMEALIKQMLQSDGYQMSQVSADFKNGLNINFPQGLIRNG